MVRWLLIFLGCLSAAEAAPVAVRDDSGAWVRLAAPAQRIVSLAPALTEVLFSVGAGSRIVAVDQASDFPPAAAALPRVGSAVGADLERLVALRPDLVVLWGSGAPARLIQWLRDTGTPVYVSEPRDLEHVAITLERLGRLTGHQPQAVLQAAAFRERIDSIRQRYHKHTPVSVFYQVWGDPLITVNGAQFISEVIGLCGGRNVFAALDASAPHVSIEAVLAQDPGVMVAGVTPGQPDPLAQWRRWPFLRAVRNQHLFLVPADLLQRPSMRLLQGAQRLCEQMAGIGSELSAHR